MNKSYHFIGIGGIGMGAIAALLLARGNRVSGSDLKENQVTIRLKEQGARISIGHSAQNLETCDRVIYSSAIPADNPEMLSAAQKGMLILKRAQMLAELMNPQIGITVAGAHGKTTTTSMAAYLLIRAGLEPTTAVGGIINGGSYSANLGGGKYFVAEVDESDGSFLYFQPRYSIITNIDFEHVDYYGNWDNILKAYRAFIENTKPEGTMIACGDDERLSALLRDQKRKTMTYGFAQTNDLYSENISLNGYHSSFDGYYQGKRLANFELKVPGRHNVLNAMATCSLGLALGIDLKTIQISLKEYTGVQRRFEKKGEVNDILVVDDYGHHPTEIVATLKTAQSFHRKRVIAVFQPHRYTRTKFLMNDFTESLLNCDYLIVTDIYAAGEQPIAGVEARQLVEKIKDLNKIPAVYLKKEDILQCLLGLVKPGDLVLTLGAGDITKLSDDFVSLLARKLSGVQAGAG